MAGFNLSGKNPTDKKSVDEFCLRMSDKLRRFVRKMNWFPVSRSPRKWSDEVRKLRNDLSGDEALIESVLDRYMDLVEKNGSRVVDLTGNTQSNLPQCKDFMQFRRCWHWVTNVLNKHDRDNPTVQITDAARRVTKVLSRKGWPGSAKDKLEQAVQVSLDNLKRFRDSVRGLGAAGSHDWTMFVTRLNMKTEGLESFIEKWLSDVHDRIKDWEAWNGNIMTEVFRSDSKHFHRWGKKVSVDWSGSSDLWFQLCERLKINAT